MSAKLNSLNELRNILTQKEKADEGVLAFSKQFKIGQLLKPFSAAKKQGYSLMSIFLVLILSRLGGLSIYAAQKTDNLSMGDNTILTMITYTILTLYKRFESYETLGALFRETQKEMLEKTLCERIEMVILKILRDLLEFLLDNTLVKSYSAA